MIGKLWMKRLDPYQISANTLIISPKGLLCLTPKLLCNCYLYFFYAGKPSFYSLSFFYASFPVYTVTWITAEVLSAHQDHNKIRGMWLTSQILGDFLGIVQLLISNLIACDQRTYFVWLECFWIYWDLFMVQNMTYLGKYVRFKECVLVLLGRMFYKCQWGHAVQVLSITEGGSWNHWLYLWGFLFLLVGLPHFASFVLEVCY